MLKVSVIQNAFGIQTKYHFWLGTKSGYMCSEQKECPFRAKEGEKLKYMGYTTTMSGWPKVMNTGRVLHKPIIKKKLS